MTIRQLTERKFLQDRFGGRRKEQTSTVQDRPSREAYQECAAPQWQTAPLPIRPDDTVLSDSIPLFFIGRNHNSFGSHAKLRAAAAVFFFSGDRRLDLPAEMA